MVKPYPGSVEMKQDESPDAPVDPNFINTGSMGALGQGKKKKKKKGKKNNAANNTDDDPS